MRLLLTLVIVFFLQFGAYAQIEDPERTALSCVLTTANLVPDECSTLEFKVHGLDPAGRYSVLIDGLHVKWLRERDDAATARQHVHHLNMFNALNNCSIGDATFLDCQDVMDDAEQACMAQGGYSTAIMGSCASIQDDILGLVLIAEIAVLTAIEKDFIPFDERQPHRRKSLIESQEAWETFVRAECDRRYWNYYPGTMANLVWLGCRNGFQKQRIGVINRENRQDNRDANTVDVEEIIASIVF